MFKNKLSSKLSWLLIPFTLALGYVGWKRWLLTVPEPLPSKLAFAFENNNSFSDGTYYEVFIPPTKTDKYLSAEYRIWIPKDVKSLRGLIVKQHGCGDPAAASGLKHANDLQWQALASKHQFALVGTKYATNNQICENWALLNSGSEGAFLKAIRTFAQKSSHPELNKVPWVLWGHSGGADWSAQMLHKYPNRTIAVVAARCGGSTLPKAIDPKLWGVPVLFATAEKENTLVDECRDLPKRIFFRYRKENALWTLAEEANTTHETGDTRLLAIPYLDKIISERIISGSNKLRSVDTAQEWLGNTATHEIASVNQYKENPLQAAWLPNKEIAGKWQEYVTIGKISPTRQPIAPTNVRATKIHPTEVLITWNFTPDLDNGLPSFRIYRDRSLVKTLEGQKHDFGDAAEPQNVVLEFRDRQANLNSTYAVAAFNQLGESVSQATRSIENK
jgi:hypothetical protein